MGAGFHGGFGDTHGLKDQNNYNPPISKSGDVRYSDKKTVKYLLNPNHKEGGPKAKFMHDVLGYTQNDSKLFHKNVVNSIIGKTPVQTKRTQYGVKHVFNTELIGKSGKSVKANVVVVVQKDDGRITYKIVTVYPGKKE